MSDGFIITCGKCGGEDSVDRFTQDPAGRDYPAGSYQCPNPDCRQAFKIVQGPGRFIEVEGCEKRMYIPGKKTIVEIPVMYEGCPA